MPFNFHLTAASSSTTPATAPTPSGEVGHPDHISRYGVAQKHATSVAAAAPPPSAHAARLWQHAARHAHAVLNNGQAIKHLAEHRGYAIAGDGTRLFFEVYEVRPAAPTGASPAGTPGTGAGTGMAVAADEEVSASIASAAPAAMSLSGPTLSAASPAAQAAASPPASAGPAAAAPSAAGAASASPLHAGGPDETSTSGGSGDSGENLTDVLLIMGFAAGRDGWLPLIHHWMRQAGSEALHRLTRVRFAVFDNRGIGDSDSPAARASYSTAIMAQDALAVMDHLHWRRAHVVGFSMGGMVALKLGAAAPERLLSLTALSVTGGGWQIIPTKWRAIKLLLWAAIARTPAQRAAADVHFHFSRDTLLTQVETAALGSEDPSAPAPKGVAAAAAAHVRRVEEDLVDEYVATSQGGAPQPHAGQMGQLHAVWNHGLSAAEQQRLRELAADGVPVKVVHGSHDLMAHWQYGERTAKHVRATFILIDGGHFIVRECAPEVCMHVANNIVAASANVIVDASENVTTNGGAHATRAGAATALASSRSRSGAGTVGGMYAGPTMSSA